MNNAASKAAEALATKREAYKKAHPYLIRDRQMQVGMKVGNFEGDFTDPDIEEQLAEGIRRQWRQILGEVSRRKSQWGPSVAGLMARAQVVSAAVRGDAGGEEITLVLTLPPALKDIYTQRMVTTDDDWSLALTEALMTYVGRYVELEVIAPTASEGPRNER